MMFPLNIPELRPLIEVVKRYDPEAIIPHLGGLLTAAHFQANTLRIELLAHLAVAYSEGTRPARVNDIANLLNSQMKKTPILSQEDPVEDVFITNILTSRGNRRLFSAAWDGCDYYLQVTLDTLGRGNAPPLWQELLHEAHAILSLSDALAERVDLNRWHLEESRPGSPINPGSTSELLSHAKAVSFTKNDLQSLGIALSDLRPFILPEPQKEEIRHQSIGHSSLERHPLVETGEHIVFVLPHALSVGIRRYVLNSLRSANMLTAFGRALAETQAQQIAHEFLRELHNAKYVGYRSPHSLDERITPQTLQYDRGRYLHIVVLHDDLKEAESEGLSGCQRFSKKDSDALGDYLVEVAEHCRSQPSFEGGATLLVYAGIGRGIVIPLPHLPDDWNIATISVPDLLILATETPSPLTRFLRFMEQRDWAANRGLRFMSISGDFAHYGQWKESNYNVVPADIAIAPGNMIQMGSDMALPIRKRQRALLDSHMVEKPTGDFATVWRLNQDSFFPSLRERPIYVSVDDLKSGRFLGVIETPCGRNWLRMEFRNTPRAESVLHWDIFSGFLSAYDVLCHTVEKAIPPVHPTPTEITLDFRRVDFASSPQLSGPPTTAVEPTVKYSHPSSTATILLPREFFQYFQQPENIGECMVVGSLTKVLYRLHGQKEPERDLLTKLIRTVLPTPGCRILHAFSVPHPAYELLARKAGRPSFVLPEEGAFAAIDLPGCVVGSGAPESIRGIKKCNQFLHRIVEGVWKDIRTILAKTERTGLIRELVRIHEAALEDRNQWKRTALALLSLYPAEDGIPAIACKREMQRSTVSLATRTLMEMALCECPDGTGNLPSNHTLNRLMARTAFMLEAAMDSDAIFHEISPPTIRLNRNGTYSINHELRDDVVVPFRLSHSRTTFEAHASNYAELYETPKQAPSPTTPPVELDIFDPAFHEEFGLSQQEVIVGGRALIDAAVNSGSHIMELAREQLADILQRGGLCTNAIEAFVSVFGLCHRPQWDVPPPGFGFRDIAPWRFGRRYSAIVRPLLLFGDAENSKAVYGLGALIQGIRYLVERSKNAELPPDFFESAAMRKYIGTQSNENGHNFELETSERLRSAGWHTRTTVNMSELSAPSVLGDIDVLAWKPDETVLIVECKCVKLARSLAEVAELCRRFRGEARDKLDKHIQRVQWIRANLSCLEKIVGFSPPLNRLSHRVVTDTHVPMTYMEGLPIDSTLIGPLSPEALAR